MQLKDKKIFNINKLSPKEADDLSIQIGSEVREICDKAAVEVNSILSLYGMSAKISIVFDELSKEKSEKSNKKSGKPKRASKSNLNT